MAGIREPSPCTKVLDHHNALDGVIGLAEASSCAQLHVLHGFIQTIRDGHAVDVDLPDAGPDIRHQSLQVDA